MTACFVNMALAQGSEPSSTYVTKGERLGQEPSSTYASKVEGAMSKPVDTPAGTLGLAKRCMDKRNWGLGATTAGGVVAESSWDVHGFQASANCQQDPTWWRHGLGRVWRTYLKFSGPMPRQEV